MLRRMSRLLLFLALAAAGCSPVVYVPSPIPAAPLSTGVRAGGSVNPLNGRSAVRVEVSPVDGVALLGRGLFARSVGPDTSAGGYRHRGAEVGVLGRRSVSDEVMLDGGLFAGRDAVVATERIADEYVPVDLATTRLGGHVGVFIVRRGVDPDHTIRLGPAVRLTRLSVYRDDVADARATFIEQAARLLVATPALEVELQVGASRPLGRPLEGYDYRAFIGSVSATLQLDRLW